MNPGTNTTMRTVTTLDELTGLVQRRPRLFVRWSRGPDADAAGTSSDDLTGTRLPGCRPARWRSSPGGETGRCGCGSPGDCMTTVTSSTTRGRTCGRGCWRARNAVAIRTTTRGG